MRHVMVLFVLLVSLAGCHRQANAPGEAPTGLAAAPGEGQVIVTWDQVPGLTYWIFFQAGSTVTARDPGVPLLFDVQSPRVVGGLTNDVQYAFVMNATDKDSPGGPSTPVVTAVPRFAGKDWTSGAPLGSPPQNLNGVVYGAALNTLVAVGNSGTLLAGTVNYTSSNPPGVTAWTPATSVPTGFVSDLSAVTTSGSSYFALGTDGSIVTSTDGNTWTSTASIPSGGVRMNSLAFGLVSSAARYVAVGNGGTIFMSTDLTTWTLQASNTTNDLYNVAFPKDVFVATGANGTLLTSPDAITWTVQSSNTLAALRGTTYGTGPAAAASAHYVVVGDSGTIVTSTDGTSWSVTPPPLSQDLRAIRLGTRFVAVGRGGAVVYSDDAINWSVGGFPPGAPAPDLASIVFTPAMYLAVGPLGANAVSRN